MSASSDSPSDSPREVADDSQVVWVSSDATAPAPPRRSRGRRADPSATVAATEVATEVAAVPFAELATEAVAEPPAFPTTPRKPSTPEPRAEPISAPAALPTGERRVHQTIQKVDLWSVTKLSLCFYFSAMLVTLVALVTLWLIADAAGIIGNIEDLLGDGVLSKDFTFLSFKALRGALLIGLVLVALQVVVTVIAASFYNIFSELFGGVEIIVKQEESEAIRR